MSTAWKKAEFGAFAGQTRAELKEPLELSGCEISLNRLGAGQSVPFIHKHTDNEEAYVIIEGSGEFWLDGEIVPVSEGSCLRIDPSVGRCIRASKDSPITYACVQTAAGSLRQYSQTDGVIVEGSTGWEKAI